MYRAGKVVWLVRKLPESEKKITVEVGEVDLSPNRKPKMRQVEVRKLGLTATVVLPLTQQLQRKNPRKGGCGRPVKLLWCRRRHRAPPWLRTREDGTAIAKDAKEDGGCGAHWWHLSGRLSEAGLTAVASLVGRAEGNDGGGVQNWWVEEVTEWARRAVTGFHSRKREKTTRKGVRFCVDKEETRGK